MRFLCWIGYAHISINNCYIEKFENEREAITVFRCKHCGAIVSGYTIYTKAVFKRR